MNKKIIITIIFLCGIIAFSFDDTPNNNSQSLPIIDSDQLDGNNISTWFRNNGSFNRNPSTGNSGFVWPAGSNKLLRFASGLWLGAKVATDTLIAVAMYDYEYLPGYVDGNGNPQGKDDPLYRVYKISKGDTLSKDYLNWPVNQGAYLDSLGKPILPGTQTIFYSMTDGYPESHGSNIGSTAPLKAQVQVTNWCYNDHPPTELRNVIFSEFKIINKNSLQWNEAFITIWSDEKTEEDVAIGCDSLMNLGYSYCQPNSFQYKSNPPAISFLLLKGPEIYTGNPNDTVYFFIPGRSQRRIKIGYKEIKLSSLHTYYNSDPITGGPINYRETYLTMHGFKRNGSSWLNPITNAVTKFPYSGDPESGIGWNQFSTQGYANRSLQVNIGPLNMNPGDTQTIVVAQIVAQGINNLNSVTKLKQSAQYVKNVFENNFTTVGIHGNNVSEIPSGFRLEQNYPNPFNPSTNLGFGIFPKGPLRGDLEFVSLKVFDVSGKVIATLINEKLRAGNYEVNFDGSHLSSGIYFYQLTAGDFVESKRMILLK